MCDISTINGIIFPITNEASSNGFVAQTYSDTAIQCCLMIRSLFRLSLRMVTGVFQSLIKLSGLDWTAPNISDIRPQSYVKDRSILIFR